MECRFGSSGVFEVAATSLFITSYILIRTLIAERLKDGSLRNRSLN
jgi:hypothetical protein